MKNVTISINGNYVGTTIMTIEEVRRAESEGFTVVEVAR